MGENTSQRFPYYTCMSNGKGGKYFIKSPILYMYEQWKMGENISQRVPYYTCMSNGKWAKILHNESHPIHDEQW